MLAYSVRGAKNSKTKYVTSKSGFKVKMK
jgi:hypothetical protein